MRNRSKKKKKKGSSDAGIPAVGHRSWVDLPELPLACILDRLSLFSDLFAFGGVCSSWRSLFLRSDALKSQPPMLLRPVNRFKTTWANKWRKPAQCWILPLTVDPPPVSYRCKISSPTLSAKFIGSSFGNLVLNDRQRIVIADVITGEEIVAPNFPRDVPKDNHCILTAPPSSPKSWLIYSDQWIWRVGANEWSKSSDDWHRDQIEQPLLFKQCVYGFDSRLRICTLHFSPKPRFHRLEGLGPPPFSRSILVRQLVQFGDELLFVSLGFWMEGTYKLKFSAFRLDFSQKVWVEVENLGDYSLFMDARARCPMSCVNTTGWGGKRNCVYFVRSECDSWSVYPFNETLVFDKPTRGSPIYLADCVQPAWPMPIWVYPSMLFK